MKTALVLAFLLAGCQNLGMTPMRVLRQIKTRAGECGQR